MDYKALVLLGIKSPSKLVLSTDYQRYMDPLLEVRLLNLYHRAVTVATMENGQF